MDEVPFEAGMAAGTAASGPVAWELPDLERAPDVVEFANVRFEVLADGELVPKPKSARPAAIPATCVGPGFDMG